MGDEVILVIDVLGPIEISLAKALREKKAPPEQVAKFREQQLRQRLPRLIESKLVLIDAKRSIPAEALPEIEKRAGQRFEEVQLPKLMAESKAKNRAALDTMLRQTGSSLAQQKRLFFERAVFSQWIHQKVDYDPEITHEEMLTYYYEHRSDFESNAKARWEELSVSLDKFPTKQAAYQTLAKMGNDVMAGRRGFAEVARQRSQGATADQGGAHPWTGKGSLVSDVLDEALFSIELRRMSRILEDKQGFHIIRVVDRSPGGVQPFAKAQIEISKKLKKQKTDKQIKEYIAGLRKDTRIWTIFDEKPDGAGK